MKEKQKEKQGFFKWAFTRWYLYVIVLLVFWNRYKEENISYVIRTFPFEVTGSILGSFAFALVILFVIFAIFKR